MKTGVVMLNFLDSDSDEYSDCRVLRIRHGGTKCVYGFSHKRDDPGDVYLSVSSLVGSLPIKGGYHDITVRAYHGRWRKWIQMFLVYTPTPESYETANEVYADMFIHINDLLRYTEKNFYERPMQTLVEDVIEPYLHENAKEFE